MTTPDGAHATVAWASARRARATIDPLSALARRMAEAATTWLASLTPGQRSRATYAVDNDDRRNWHYVPNPRPGLALRELSGGQQKLAFRLLATGLSDRAYGQALAIMSLEAVLAELEGPGRRNPRDPDLYHFTIFGTPSDAEPWGWRVEGHHISLNFLIAGGIAFAPSFFGSNPGRVPDRGLDPRTGLAGLAGFRVLALEEDLGRRLVTTLDASQRRSAIFLPEAPADILTTNQRHVTRDTPVGIAATGMTEAQRDLLMTLVETYAYRMPDAIADHRLDQIARDGTGHIHFAWAGGESVGAPHYYRLQGPGFLVEYDNTQNGANHIHTVWRDFDHEWGDDLLASHYQSRTHGDHSDHAHAGTRDDHGEHDDDHHGHAEHDGHGHDDHGHAHGDGPGQHTH